MSAADLSTTVAALRQFEKDARALSVLISPMLRRAMQFPFVASMSADLDGLSPAVSGPLHRANLVLGEVVGTIGHVVAELSAVLPAPAPQPEEAMIEVVAEPVEVRPAKVTKRR